MKKIIVLTSQCKYNSFLPLTIEFIYTEIRIMLLFPPPPPQFSLSLISLRAKVNKGTEHV